MAIKLFGVKPTRHAGEAERRGDQTQDFVLLDHPLFFTPNVASLVAFSRKKKSLVLEKDLTGKALFEALKESFPKEVRLLEGRKKHIKSPLEEEYFSTTPYKLGETAVKYSAKPEQVQGLPPRGLGRTAEAATSNRQVQSTTRHPAARFGFYVQRQSDPVGHADRGPDCRMEVGLGESGDD